MLRLLAVAGERKPVYLMAVHTGLRRSELAALNWDDLHLDAVTPFVEVRASTTRNSKPAEMRLLCELAAALGELKGNGTDAGPGRASAWARAGLRLAAIVMVVAGVGVCLGDGGEFDDGGCSVAKKPGGKSYDAQAEVSGGGR
jgi:hypothetical protein